MKTTQNNFRYILLLMVIFTSLSSCKKERVPENDQEKFEKAMLAAGFKLVDEADIPKGITPYKLSNNEIQSFLNNPHAREDSLKHIISQNNLKLTNNQMSVKTDSKFGSIMMDGEDPIEEGPILETKVFLGNAQTYYFNTVSVDVSLTFNKIKVIGGGTKWVESNHTIKASKISNQTDNTGNYYGAGDYTISFNGTSCSYNQQGNLYYVGFGQHYNKPFPVSASGGSNGTNLLVTFP
jgi:hypothetical protein